METPGKIPEKTQVKYVLLLALAIVCYIFKSAIPVFFLSPLLISRIAHISICLNAELATSLFEIAQSLFTIERTLISGANERFKKKSKERWAI